MTQEQLVPCRKCQSKAYYWCDEPPDGVQEYVACTDEGCGFTLGGSRHAHSKVRVIEEWNTPPTKPAEADVERVVKLPFADIEDCKRVAKHYTDRESLHYRTEFDAGAIIRIAAMIQRARVDGYCAAIPDTQALSDALEEVKRLQQQLKWAVDHLPRGVTIPFVIAEGGEQS